MLGELRNPRLVRHSLTGYDAPAASSGGNLRELPMRIAPVALIFILAGTSSLLAEDAHPDIVKTPGDLKWGPPPPNSPAGTQMAVLSGDPTKSAPYVLRLKLPANFKIAPHHHPTTENVTVLSGTFHAGMGDKFDEKNGVALEPGAFASLPAGMNHYAWTGAETVVQFHGQGPFKVEFVNAADDPSKK
jgi:quercetin dioxygenase-like cupin family protein